MTGVELPTGRKENQVNPLGDITCRVRPVVASMSRLFVNLSTVKLKIVVILQSIIARDTYVLEMAGSVGIIGLRKTSDLASLGSHVLPAGTKLARVDIELDFSCNCWI